MVSHLKSAYIDRFTNLKMFSTRVQYRPLIVELFKIVIPILLFGLVVLNAPVDAQAQRTKARPTAAKRFHKWPRKKPQSASLSSKISKRSWLNHYLKEDRLRIRGGLWRYVSTEYDGFYHRPQSAFMLSQSPDHVIGFVSAADAQEAGYRPHPTIARSAFLEILAARRQRAREDADSIKPQAADPSALAPSDSSGFEWLRPKVDPRVVEQERQWNIARLRASLQSRSPITSNPAFR